MLLLEIHEDEIRWPLKEQPDTGYLEQHMKNLLTGYKVIHYYVPVEINKKVIHW